MKDIYVSTAVTLSGAGAGPAAAGATGPDITPGEAVVLLEKQAALVELDERAELGLIRSLMSSSAYFTEVERRSHAVGLLIPEDRLRRAGSPLGQTGTCIEANLHHYGAHFALDHYDFLYSEGWWDQAAGTCFLVDDKKLLTARHVAQASDVRRALANGSLRVVFDYQYTANNRPCAVFCKAIEVFEIRAMQLPPPGPGDWIALELKDSATKSGRRSKLPISPDRPLANTPVYTLGHPNHASLRYAKTSLPLELATCQFGAYLDAYEGSSGSPVFSALSHDVIGLITTSFQPVGAVKVRGENRFISQLCLPEYSKATLCEYSAAFAGNF